MNAEAILKELVSIRVARKAKFVPYDLDRRLKRKEKDMWQLAEKYFEPKAEVPKLTGTKGGKVAA